jgi:hypothetical protein
VYPSSQTIASLGSVATINAIVASATATAPTRTGQRRGFGVELGRSSTTGILRRPGGLISSPPIVPG